LIEEVAHRPESETGGELAPEMIDARDIDTCT
jgi:hypothetical protein